MGMAFLALGFLRIEKGLVKQAELPIEQNEYKLDRTIRHNTRTNAIVSQANKGFCNLEPRFWIFQMRLLVTLTVACAPRTQPAHSISLDKIAKVFFIK